MYLIETTVSNTTVRMRLADYADPAQAKQWIEFVVPLDEERKGWHLAAIQRVALQTARTAIDAEIQAARQRLDQDRDR